MYQMWKQKQLLVRGGGRGFWGAWGPGGGGISQRRKPEQFPY